jgi:uncharacterized protein YndB with AHSA1/START domain
MKSDVSIDGDRLRITRILNAPRELVFSWWAQAEKLQQWSGCKEMVRCEVAMDFRVGGSFTQKMFLDVHGKQCEFSITGTYDEIIEPARIAYRANFGHAVVRVTVEFIQQAKATKVLITHEGCPDDMFLKNVSQGMSDSLDQLDSIVSNQMAAL